jgi:hypothetical protein
LKRRSNENSNRFGFLGADDYNQQQHKATNAASSSLRLASSSNLDHHHNHHHVNVVDQRCHLTSCKIATNRKEEEIERESSAATSSSSLSSSSLPFRPTVPDNGENSTRKILISEKLLKTVRIWYLPTLDKSTIIGFLANRPTGVRRFCLMRRCFRSFRFLSQGHLIFFCLFLV